MFVVNEEERLAAIPTDVWRWIVNEQQQSVVLFGCRGSRLTADESRQLLNTTTPGTLANLVPGTLPYQVLGTW